MTTIHQSMPEEERKKLFESIDRGELGKSAFAIKIGQMFCRHNWDVKSWRLHGAFPKPTHKNPLVLSTCQKCGKIRLLKPSDAYEVKDVA